MNNNNIFAALGSLKKKKNKDQIPSKEADKKDVFWAPTPLTAKSWADVDDEDDDDYYATTAPPQSSWLNADKQNEAHDAVGVTTTLSV